MNKMKQLSLAMLPALVLSLSTTISSADEFQSLSVSVPKGEKLSVRIPPAWRHTVLQPAPNLPPTLKITTLSNSVSLQITFLPDPEGRFATRETADRAATQANQHYVAGSVEKRLTLTQIVSTNGHGCYATFTDADLADVPHPRPGEFKHVVSGLFVIKKQLATFTLLTNDPKSAEYRQALQIISDGISAP
jgi:hypothetical protein